MIPFLKYPLRGIDIQIIISYIYCHKRYQILKLNPNPEMCSNEPYFIPLSATSFFMLPRQTNFVFCMILRLICIMNHVSWFFK